MQINRFIDHARINMFIKSHLLTIFVDMITACTYPRDMVKKSSYLNINTTFRPDWPYNDLPLLPPKQAIETLPVMRNCVAASRSLAALKEAAA